MRAAISVLALLIVAIVQASIQRNYGVGIVKEDTSNNVAAQVCLELEELNRNNVKVTNKCSKWVIGELETVKCNGSGGYTRQQFAVGAKGETELETNTHEFSNRRLFCLMSDGLTLNEILNTHSHVNL
jgi:hypothetical protein